MEDEPQLAGEFLVLDEEPGKSASGIRFDNKGLGRVCGSCQLCCRLLPVPKPPLNKPAGQRCVHQRFGKGCAIHDKRPFACRSWSCRWMSDPKAKGLPRPDRCHYVVDSILDFITAKPHDGSAPQHVSVVQVWVDPDYPDAHRDPRLRAYLLMMAQDFRCAALVRYDSSRAFTLVAPPLSDDGQWHELGGITVAENSAERAAMIAGPPPEVVFQP
jgi:hypothetical protein